MRWVKREHNYSIFLDKSNIFARSQISVRTGCAFLPQPVEECSDVGLCCITFQGEKCLKLGLTRRREDNGA